jgi:YgiT-type zinc finger domain-containing protein
MPTRCVQCRSDQLEITSTELTARVGTHRFAGTAPATRCAQCGETYVPVEVGERFEREVARVLAEHGVADPDVFRFTRRVIGLRAVDLAVLLGVTPETLSRWENGRSAIDRSTFAALGGLLEDLLEGTTRMRDRLQALARPRRLGRARHLNLAG